MAIWAIKNAKQLNYINTEVYICNKVIKMFKNTWVKHHQVVNINKVKNT